jgi:hypothetical protein
MNTADTTGMTAGPVVVVEKEMAHRSQQVVVAVVFLARVMTAGTVTRPTRLLILKRLLAAVVVPVDQVTWGKTAVVTAVTVNQAVSPEQQRRTQVEDMGMVIPVLALAEAGPIMPVVAETLQFPAKTETMV